MDIPEEAVKEIVSIANRVGLEGRRIERVYWVPPATPTQDFRGSWAIEYAPPRSGSDPV